MTGTNCDLFTHKSSRSYLNHLVKCKVTYIRFTEECFYTDYITFTSVIKTALAKALYFFFVQFHLYSYSHKCNTTIMVSESSVWFLVPWVPACWISPCKQVSYKSNTLYYSGYQNKYNIMGGACGTHEGRYDAHNRAHGQEENTAVAFYSDSKTT
jgi:hypothetical protein